MATIHEFNAENVDPKFGFDPIPQGKYLAIISDSEMKATKAGGGRYLQLTFQIIDGDHKGRLVWSRLNIENANAQTVKYARAELSAICRATGVMAPKDSVELHNLPLIISVGLKKRSDTSELTNVIRGYERKDAGKMAPAASNAGKAPWQR